MSLDEIYARLKRRLEETNRVIDEKYWCLAENVGKTYGKNKD
jgi:hypothetical protein